MSESTSSREEHVGEVVFSRSGGIGDQAEDWDDSSLIEAYDAALGGILDKLDKRQQRPASQRTSTSTQSASSSQTRWKRGDFCRAQYTVDNQWYEGKILAVDGAYCIVEYVGYKNHERQPLKSLRPSGGQKQRQLQIKAAELDEGGESDGSRTEELSAADNVSVKSGQSSSTKKRTQDERSPRSQHQRQQQQLEHLLHLQEQHQRFAPDDEYQQKTVPKESQGTKDSSRKRGAHEPSMPSMIAFPPPPPPFPPGVDEICDGDEALAAMLISWYISGYHTGYYTAVRKASNR